MFCFSIRFEVHYKVSDDTDTCSIVFFNKEASELFGGTAAQLQKKLEEASHINSVIH